MDTRIIIGAASAVIGAGIGALVTWRLLKAHYEEITQDEIDSVKLHYAKLFKEGEHADLEGLVAKYKTKVNRLGYSGEKSDDSNVTDEEAESVDDTPSNSDEETDDDDDNDETYDDDLKEPDEVRNIWRFAKDHPHPEDEAYVITFDQYNDEHDDYDKGDLTYYEGDDILVDSQESPIDDVEGLIGPDALTRFGDGSKSRDIVYVRNDRISMDFEISRDERSYTEHIIGVHDGSKKDRRKMRAEE